MSNASRQTHEPVRRCSDCHLHVHNMLRGCLGWQAKILFKAASSGQDDIVQALLEAGGQLEADVRNQYGTPVIVEAAQGRHETCVKLLLEAGADMAAVYKDGLTVLVDVICRWRSTPNLSIAKLLVEATAKAGALNAVVRNGAKEACGVFLACGVGLGPVK